MEHTSLANVVRATRRMFIRDLVLAARIGVYAQEHGRSQRIRVNVDLAVEDDGAANLSRPAVGADDLRRVVDYGLLVEAVRRIATGRHIQLVETFAERVAEACLEDQRVRVVRVTVEKLDVFADAASVGVEIERRNI
ncbi:dihydroneopterin aldolase [Acidocella sp.]|uniref:dihydroneopterin aldolase n=1 Tax=Acidocella sp. TaxID=50710 RepID=UPI00261C9F0B|nr:dihydroneopterin aldolase [Acidocella sp.]